MASKTPQKRVLFTRSPRPIWVALLVVLLLSFAFFTRPAAAVANPTINFQARLMTSSGAIAADGSYSVAFNLYSAASGGTALWTETQTLSVANGYLTANLGSVNAFANATTPIPWGSPLWLTMNVNSDGEMAPRLSLTAVPTALALTSSNATGFVSTLSFTAPTANETIVLPAESSSTETVCYWSDVNCGFLSGTSGVQLQSSSPGTQQTGNFNISGTGVAGTLQAPNLTSTGALTATAGTGVGTGAGGQLTLQGGMSGSGAAATGGEVLIQGGTANGTGASNGGNIVIQGGTAAGTGVEGQIQINGPLLYTATTYSSGTSSTITLSSVNSYTTILATATTGGLTFTVPSPTTATAGRILQVSNAGTNAFTLAGGGTSFTLNPGSTATLMWNGSVWTNAGVDASTLQSAYTNSIGGTTPNILLSSTLNGVSIQAYSGMSNNNFLTLYGPAASLTGAQPIYSFGGSGAYTQDPTVDGVNFQIQQDNGGVISATKDVLSVDTTTAASVVNLGSTSSSSGYNGSTVNIVTTNNANGTVNIGGTSLGGSATQTINIGYTATTSGTTNVNIGAASPGAGSTTVRGAGGLTLTGGAASTWSTTAGALTLQGFAGLNDYTAATSTTSTNSSAIQIQTGNATGTTSSSGTVTISTGSGTTNSGNISIDTGVGTTANGSINIGTAHASSVTIGVTTGTSPTTIQGGTGGINLNTNQSTGASVIVRTYTNTNNALVIRNANNIQNFATNTVLEGTTSSNAIVTVGNYTTTSGQGVSGSIYLADGSNDGYYASLTGNGTGTDGTFYTANQSLVMPNLSGAVFVVQASTPGVVQTGNFNISGTGIVGTQIQSPQLETAATNTTSTNSSQLLITSGNATGTTSTSGAVIVSTGSGTTNSGNISIDTGVGTAANGSISIGIAHASSIAIGQSGTTTIIGGGVLYTPSGGFSSGTSATVTASLLTNNAVVPIAATAASLTFTMPTTGMGSAGRVVYVTNNGSNQFLLNIGPDILNFGTSSTATLYWNGTSWSSAGLDSGVTSIGAFDGQTPNSSGATLFENALYLQSASATNPGLVNTGSSGVQTFAGAKTFNGALVGNAGINVSGGAITLTGNAASALTSTNSVTITGGAASTWSTTAGALTLQGFAGLNDYTAATSTTSTNSSAIQIQTGNATGTTSSSGNITLEVGTATGTAGSINIGNTGTIANIINIAASGSSGVTQTVNIGNAGSGNSIVSIGSTTGTGYVTINAGSTTNGPNGGAINMTINGPSGGGGGGLVLKTINNNLYDAFVIQNANGLQTLAFNTVTGEMTIGNMSTTVGNQIQGILTLADGSSSSDGDSINLETAAMNGLPNNTTLTQLLPALSGTLVITQSSGTPTAQTGNISLSGMVQAPTFNTASTAATSTNSSALAIQSGNATGTTSNSGNVTVEVGTATGTTGNIILGTTATAFLTVNTSGGIVQIGSGSGTTTSTLLDLNNYSTATDPAGVAGGMYYNTALGGFRCYGGTVWTACNGFSASNTAIASAFTGSTATEQVWTPGTNITANTGQTYQLPANYCVAGRTFSIHAEGIYSTTTTAQATTLKVKIGSTVLGATGANTPTISMTGQHWNTEFNIICESTTSAIGEGYTQVGTSTLNTTGYWPMENAAAVTIPATASNLTMSVTFGGTASASNTITLQELVIRSSGP